MTRLLMSGVLAWILVGGIAAAQDAAQPADSTQRSLKLIKVMAALSAGAPYASLRGGINCSGDPVTRTYPGGETALSLAPYSAPFKLELQGEGYKVVTPKEDNLFDPETGAADYEVAAVITTERIEGCMSPGGLWTKANRGDVSGKGFMNVDWQIYSRLEKRVVAHIPTSGTSQLDQAVPGGLQQLMVAAFSENVRDLASSNDFRAAMSAPKAVAGAIQMPDQQSKIVLGGSLKAAPRKIADAVGDVVTVMNDLGSGSGILVSNDGYILTNAHVVGDDKQARVRWSDGIETLAQVVRISKNRDVALIKTNARDRAPLALKRGAVTPGERVYAIGSPNGKDFQGTVSSGVISADRTIDGLRYIQSDVAISPGSSGGALLNESGSVIGIAVMTYMNGGKPAALNMFIPIGDAMDFLVLEQQ